MDKVLMIFRNKRPNQFKWNGLGGKLEEGEEPDDSAARELLEEASLKDVNLKYRGIVTWYEFVGGDTKIGGMYTYTSIINTDSVIFDQVDKREGNLDWKEVVWVNSFDNAEVVENIPYFLPYLLGDDSPAEYRCTYLNKKLENFEVLPLPKG